MGLLTCYYPENDNPLGLLRGFKEQLAPVVIDIEESDVFSTSAATLEAALAVAGQQKKAFQPLISMQRNATQFRPQFRLLVRIDKGEILMEGAINRRLLSLTWDDPIPDIVLRRVFAFAKGIAGAEIEAEDDAGNPMDIA
jgi:hypothetical protein